MAATKTKDATKPKTGEQPLAQQAPDGNLPVAAGSQTLRIPYPKSLGEYAGIDARTWGVLIDSIWPNAKTIEGVTLAVTYCKRRNLDPLKKPIHIVPIFSKALNREVEGIWPGINEVRTTATRTGIYAGKDAAEFGPNVTETLQHIDDRNDAVKDSMEVTYPEWCRLTVYKIVQGVRCAFVGPKVFWKETYATENRFSNIPNEMWANRKSGQLEKCTEAASLRAAFPEELGNTYTAEEMAGRTIEGAALGGGEIATGDSVDTSVMTPPRPKESEFKRDFDKKKDKGKPEGTGIGAADPKKPAGDPRPDPPAEGEPVAVQGQMHEADNKKTAPAEEDRGPYLKALGWLDEYGSTIADAEDLAEYKKLGRTTIDALEGVEEDEKDVLRGRFSTLVLEETRKRGTKKR